MFLISMRTYSGQGSSGKGISGAVGRLLCIQNGASTLIREMRPSLEPCTCLSDVWGFLQVNAEEAQSLRHPATTATTLAPHVPQQWSPSQLPQRAGHAIAPGSTQMTLSSEALRARSPAKVVDRTTLPATAGLATPFATNASDDRSLPMPPSPLGGAPDTQANEVGVASPSEPGLSTPRARCRPSTSGDGGQASSSRRSDYCAGVEVQDAPRGWWWT